MQLALRKKYLNCTNAKKGLHLLPCPPSHRDLFICMVVEVLVDERKKIMKVGSRQVAIEENGECRSVDRNELFTMH